MPPTRTVYVDTNVFIDFFRGRDPAAYSFFMRALGCEFELCIADLVLKEIAYQRLEREMENLQGLYGEKLAVTDVQAADERVASTIDTDHNDALHAAVALRLETDAFLTKNTKDFIDIPQLPLTHPDII